jgi:hypothetical protein
VGEEEWVVDWQVVKGCQWAHVACPDWVSVELGRWPRSWKLGALAKQSCHDADVETVAQESLSAVDRVLSVEEGGVSAREPHEQFSLLGGGAST